jgi:oligoribonuclease NrnB/cAMP/cGMP phosphodiesterase (DHH superfamily)
MKDKMVIYHAACLDGFAAAYIAWLKFGDEVEYIPAHYGNEPPDVTGKEVYILDFSYPRETLIRMSEKANSLLVLDHHKTAQADLSGLPFAVFDMEKSGCGLAFEYFYPGTQIPYFVARIQDRDLWRFNYEDTKDFCAGLRTVAMSFQAWEYVLTNSFEVDEVLTVGSCLNKQFDDEVADLVKKAHPLFIAGGVTRAVKTGLAVNAPAKYASELGNKLAEKSGVCGLVYSFDGSRNEWQYSFRSIDSGIDVSAVAKRHGGGGHRNAAGCTTEKLFDFSSAYL